MSFKATARIPTRPLSMENSDLAVPKELLVDYTTREIFVCDVNGEIVNVTASVSVVLEQVIQALEEDPSTVTDAEITLPSGENVTIENSILLALSKIEELKTLFNVKTDEQGNPIVDEDGNPIIELPATNVETDDDHQFVSETEKTTWDNKTEIITLNAVVRAGDSFWTLTTDTDGDEFYTQRIDLEEILESDNPLVDVVLSDLFKKAMDQLDSYAYIYKIHTYDGYMIVYATSPTETNLSLVIKCDRK